MLENWLLGNYRVKLISGGRSNSTRSSPTISYLKFANNNIFKHSNTYGRWNSDPGPDRTEYHDRRCNSGYPQME